MGALAGVVSVLVGLPPFAAAPAPGALPQGAEVRVLDRPLGIAEVQLPRAGLASSLIRLRHAPGTRYATVEQPVTLAGDGCTIIGNPPQTGLPRNWWRSAVHMPAKVSANGFPIAVVDSGADIERLGSHQVPIVGRDFTSGSGDWSLDRLGHGTAVASLLAANRPDIKISGIAPSADLIVARIATTGACAGAPLEANMVKALAWLRTQDVLVVNVSASVKSSPAVRDEVRGLQLRGALIVAAAGNVSEGGTSGGYPSALPHVLGVGAMSRPGRLDGDSVHGRNVDLVAPGSSLGVMASSAVKTTSSITATLGGTSFATPLVAGAAALVWAAHREYSAGQVAAALRRGAQRLGQARPNDSAGWGVLDVRASLREHPATDPAEPNDWVAAALSQNPQTTRPAHTLLATLDVADDPIDAYRVTLKAGQRLHLRWSSELAGLRVLVEPPGVSTGLLDGPLSAADGAAVSSKDGSSGQLSFKAPRSGDYLIVLAGETGRGPYSLTLRR